MRAHAQRRRQTDAETTNGNPEKRLILIPSPSLTVNHSALCFHTATRHAPLPTPLPSLPPILCGYQAGAEGLSPADSRSSEGMGEVGVWRGETWVGGVSMCVCVCVESSSSGTIGAYPAPPDIEVRGHAGQDGQRNMSGVCICVRLPCVSPYIFLNMSRTVR